jgi:hypothetical protein
MRLRALLGGLVVASTAAFVVGTTLERNSKHGHNESAATLKAEGATPTPTQTQPARTTPAVPIAKSKRRPPKKTGAAANPAAHAGESAAHRRAEGLPLETNTATSPGAHAGESAAHRKAEGLAPQTTTGSARSRRPRTGESRSAGVARNGHVEANAAESAAAHAAEGAGRETHAELKPLGIDIEAVPFVVLAALVSLGLAAAVWWRPRWLALLVVVAATMLAFTALDVREIFHQNDEGQTGLAVLAGAVAALHLAVAIVAGLMARAAAGAPPGPAGPAATMET